MKIIKKIKFPLVLLSSIALVACVQEKETKNSAKTKILVKTNQVSANRLLNAEIEGMVCKMGCGSSIRKELIKTNAVESCEFDFEEERKNNFVKVAFDKDKITADKIVSIINSMNEKQFKVGKIETTDFESEVKTIKEEACENQSSCAEESKIKVSETDFETPNLLSIFSRLITG